MIDEAKTIAGSPERVAPGTRVRKSTRGLLGQTIDHRYRVDSLIGEGGMGLVYRVTHTRLNKTLALKVLRRENTSDPEVVERFQREAESASAIGSEHIIDILDFGELSDGSTYFVMEALDGVDLIDAIDEVERLPEDRAIRIALQVCRALTAAHDAGIVHRDLKPENVFLIRREEQEDFVKILDFGIAKVAHGPSRLTRAGEVIGTPHYMSPEQCKGAGVDHRTDIYALGVLLYEMVTGYVPHDADTLMGILTKHVQEEPVAPQIRATDVSDELGAVIMRCLQKAPDHRYQSMHDLLADLERVKAGLPPVDPPSVTSAAVRSPRAARRRLAIMSVGGVALAASALTALFALSSLANPAVDAAGKPGPPTLADAEGATEIPLIHAPEVPTRVGPPPMLARDIGGGAAMQADQAASGSSADATPTPGRPRPKADQHPRTPRQSLGEPPSRDPSILDPWD